MTHPTIPTLNTLNDTDAPLTMGGEMLGMDGHGNQLWLFRAIDQVANRLQTEDGEVVWSADIEGWNYTAEDALSQWAVPPHSLNPGTPWLKSSGAFYWTRSGGPRNHHRRHHAASHSPVPVRRGAPPAGLCAGPGRPDQRGLANPARPRAVCPPREFSAPESQPQPQGELAMSSPVTPNQDSFPIFPCQVVTPALVRRPYALTCAMAWPTAAFSLRPNSPTRKTWTWSY